MQRNRLSNTHQGEVAFGIRMSTVLHETRRQRIHRQGVVHGDRQSVQHPVFVHEFTDVTLERKVATFVLHHLHTNVRD